MGIDMLSIELEKATCDLCGGDNATALYSMPDLRHGVYCQEYTVVQCRQCPHRYLSPRLTADTMHLAYPSDYYANRDEGNRKQVERYARQASMLPHSPGKLLDVGCAGGAWIAYMQRLGWDCMGQDYVKSPAVKEGLDIHYGSLPEIGISPGTFDVVTAWGVMEHVPAPSEYFRTIRKLLKPGGLFLFMVPNGDSLWSRWSFKEDIPRHIHFFRKKAVKQYAEKYDFTIRKMVATNAVYSRPATGQGAIRRNIMRQFGFSWAEIDTLPESGIKRFAARVGGKLDSFIRPDWEEKLGLAGNLIVHMTKD